MTSPSTTSAPLLREVITIPERSSDSDFVLRLTEGVTDAAATLRDYVLTDRLVGNFDEALGLIAQAVSSGQSKGVYLHGSFGSGKSHFMAVLHALLRGEPAARARDELAAVLGRHEGQLAGKRFLLVPFHLIGAKSIEQRVLGGYADYIHTLHPDAPVPAVHRAQSVLDDARNLRDRIGDAEFIKGLADAPGTPAAGDEEDDEDEWGDGDGGAWTSADLDTAFAATSTADPLRRRLVSDLLFTWFAGASKDLREDADAFISLDPGLTEIAAHAKGLGYDAVVLFLDELILWLANAMGDHAFVAREVQKVTNFVEGGQGTRPVPVVSFIARQRDLRELVGESVAGAVQLGFLDTLNLASGRFDTITLEDRNLPLIANRRLLRPKDADAAAAITRAFEKTTNVRAAVWDTMLGGESATGSDRDAFRLSYPFSPAFMDTLVHVSSALQRNRTALKLMRQLLIEHRDILRLGEVVPLGDLWDVITRGADKPFTDALKAEFDAAQKLYERRLRPYLLDQHGLDEDSLATARRRGGGEGETAARVRAFTGDDRLVKTLLLSALAPSVPALRNLTAQRLSALNHGSIVSPIPGREVSRVVAKVEQWAGQFGEIKFVPGDNPGVGLELVDVEVDSILQNAARYDTPGSRRVLVRGLLLNELGITTSGDVFGDRVELAWKGSKRTAEIVLGSVRDTADLRDDQFAPLNDDDWRLVLDYPFDDDGLGAVDARARVQRLKDSGMRGQAVVWVPAYLTAARLADLRMLVILDALLGGSGARFDSHAQHLGVDDRQRARSILKSRYDALLTRFRGLLRQAYGLAPKAEADVTVGYDDHLLPLWPGLRPTLAVGEAMKDAVRRLVGDLLAEQYPGHPDLDPDRRGEVVKLGELKTVFRYVRAAAEADGGSVEVDRTDRAALRRIAPALGLGEMHEVRFELKRTWVEEFNRLDAQARAAGAGPPARPDGELAVADLLRWIDTPRPRGLDQPVAALIIAAFAEQTDRAWYRHGGLLNPPPELNTITTDLVLRAQQLPSPEDWTTARQRAEVIFGVKAPALLRGRLVRQFVADVQARARERWSASKDLVGVLEQHAARLGLDLATGGPAGTGPDAVGRLRTARSAHNLLSALDVPKPGPEIVTRLARADLGGPADRLAVSISRAFDVAAAVRAAPWDIFDLVARLPEPHEIEAREILDRVRAAGAADELTVALAKVLINARSETNALLKRAYIPPPVEPPTPRSTSVSRPPAGPGAGGPTRPDTGVDASSGGRAADARADARELTGAGTGTLVDGGRPGGAEAGPAGTGHKEQHWTGTPADLDEMIGRIRAVTADRDGEIEIIWRPAP
ncbi:phage resistance protein [Pseudofrankia sp. BMG5.37]|uniref:phage resistance protein n=1 Tax=Pseudofrankia sp. BMG5.37 TaxID=3050035 RepID=UPI002893D4AE|nr:phage resistance protein [Pseudofrankia sp. BMG5.37]MDT3441472.1 phage resistance protein [Pseudofrankia sp. BMG5.37]